MEKKKLVPDVMTFLNKCSEIVGNLENDCFNQNSWSECFDLEMESPIEHILYIAFRTLCRLNFLEALEPRLSSNGKEISVGIELKPQMKIGAYRVDFLATYSHSVSSGVTEERQVIVECDSQQFHDRSEQERRYEKRRDRFFTTNGYKVFHFTGTEIKNESFRVAAEIIAYLINQTEAEILDGLENYA